MDEFFQRYASKPSAPHAAPTQAPTHAYVLPTPAPAAAPTTPLRNLSYDMPVHSPARPRSNGPAAAAVVADSTSSNVKAAEIEVRFIVCDEDSLAHDYVKELKRRFLQEIDLREERLQKLQAIIEVTSPLLHTYYTFTITIFHCAA